MDLGYLKEEVNKGRDKRQILRDEIKHASNKDKSELRKLLVTNIKKLSGSKGIEYHISYDSISEGLEPIYFWILDFLVDNQPAGLDMTEVIKDKDEYDASVASGYFGEMGTKLSVMQDRAMKMMGTINTVVRSVLNLIYDLREFSIRLVHYDNLHSQSSSTKHAAVLALKQVWMDQVDIKKSRGSINALAQQLEFVTLRDAFLAVNTSKEADKLDLNDRVRRIVKARLDEYQAWETNSETELRKRYNIEKSYLKSQVASLRYYTAWVKPYLIAARKLGMKDFTTKSGRPSPDLVNAFSNMEMHLGLFGKKIMKDDKGKLSDGKEVYACLEVDIKFRTIPRSYQGQQGSHYVHSGRTDLTFKPYALTDEEINEVYALKEQEDLELIEDMTSVSLAEIEEDIKTYLDDEDDLRLKAMKGKPKIDELKRRVERSTTSKEKAELQRQLDEERRFMRQEGIGNFASPISNVTKGFKEGLEPIKYLFGFFGFKQLMPAPEKRVKVDALKSAEKMCYTLYDIYKKAHGMITW